MQSYIYEPIPENTVLLFRETDQDPYCCQVCGKQYMDKGSAAHHGKTKHNQDKRKKVTTVTGQKPVSKEAKLEWRRESLKKQAFIRQVGIAFGRMQWL
jgi:hypothetical protein